MMEVIMIKIENLSYSFPKKDLFDNVSFTIEEGQHCAFIGTSGSGKSTLIQMIMDPERYMFDGILEIMDHCRIGYVSQFNTMDKDTEITVFEYIAQDFIRLQEEIAQLCVEMETATDFDALLKQYQEAMDAFDAIGGDDYDSIIRKKLGVADLSKHENLPVSKLSGGEFKLVQIIKEMLNSPDLLIMDEPDVFLDFEHLKALKDLINSHKKTLLIITHNRYLLNHCFDKIIHLENRLIQEFDGRYLEYMISLLGKKIELQELAAADELEIERQKKVMANYRRMASIDSQAARGSTLNARVKIIQRLEARKIQPPFVDIKVPEISLHTSNEVEEGIALSVEQYSVGFADTLLEDVSFTIGSKDKVALIGANGSGKTTLIRDIYKNDTEAIHVSEGISLAFLSQLQGEMLNESNTILDEFFELGFASCQEIKDYLKGYGFSEELVGQKISALSGGEKNILQLAKVSHSKANVLLLDEPTSHLDTYSQLALEQAIKNYNGAILMISHDFYTIANCMDYVLMIENKTIRKLSIRKFRKMIYEKYFDKDYLEIESKKKAVESEIEFALKDNDFESAKEIFEKFEELIPLL